MATVDPAAFDWGSRIMQGMEQGRARRLQDIALGQQQEDRLRAQKEQDLKMQALQEQQKSQQADSQYAQHVREAQTLFNASQALKKIPLERRRQMLETWGRSNPIIGGVMQHIPPETDLSDQSLDEFSAGMGATLQQYKSPQVSSDFLRALEIIKNPQVSEQERAAAEVALGLRGRAGAEAITPYQQAQLDIERQRLAGKEKADAAKPIETTFTKEVDKQTAKRVTSLQDTIPAVSDRLSALRSVLSGFEKGQYSTGPENVIIPDWAQSQKNQELITQINQEVLGKAEQMKGALSDKDVAFLKASVLDINKGEKANKEILAKIIATLEAAERRANSELEHYQTGGTTATYKPGSPTQKPQRGPTVSNW